MGSRLKPAVFFITGTSGAGKSTLVEHLKRALSCAEVHDFDEGGVPAGADEKWRRERTNEWLKKAQINQKSGKTTVVCGVTVPEEIRQSPAFSESLNVHYGFIHIDEQEIRRRLKARGWAKKLTDDNVHWAQHLERCVKAEDGHFIVDGSVNDALRVAEIFIK